MRACSTSSGLIERAEPIDGGVVPVGGGAWLTLAA